MENNQGFSQPTSLWVFQIVVLATCIFGMAWASSQKIYTKADIV